MLYIYKFLFIYILILYCDTVLRGGVLLNFNMYPRTAPDLLPTPNKLFIQLDYKIKEK